MTSRGRVKAFVGEDGWREIGLDFSGGCGRRSAHRLPLVRLLVEPVHDGELGVGAPAHGEQLEDEPDCLRRSNAGEEPDGPGRCSASTGGRRHGGTHILLPRQQSDASRECVGGKRDLRLGICNGVNLGSALCRDSVHGLGDWEVDRESCDRPTDRSSDDQHAVRFVNIHGLGIDDSHRSGLRGGRAFLQRGWDSLLGAQVHA
mmetsp:Transcript_33370/g.51842  ORF Transcript_33370/g.51842 Transcript_33370/m.51842 type:complete len:203 (+) Transcript_33370:907-1515(+)